MSSSPLRIRRATTDDLPELKSLWNAMRLPANELEKRLTEFQLVESADGGLLGAIGIQVLGRNARLHSEAYADFAVADAARELFGERVRTIATHHGVFRLWTQENSPFWMHWGFQPPTPEGLARLPQEWTGPPEPWLTIQLKDEAAIAAFEVQLAEFRASEKKRTEGTLAQARTMTTAITVIGFALGIVLIGVAIYIFLRRGFLPGR